MYSAEQQMDAFQAMSASDVKDAVTATGYPNDPNFQNTAILQPNICCSLKCRFLMAWI